MAMSPKDLEVIVNNDGAVNIPASKLARMGLRPGDHLRLVKDDTAPTDQRKRKSVRGIAVGKVAPEDVLTWEDFEATHENNVKWANQKYGELPE